MDFKLTGIKNTVIARGEHYPFSVKVFYLGGEKEEVTISTGNLPDGVSVVFDNTTDQPDYSLTATIYVTLNHSLDTNTIEFIGTTASGKKVSKQMQLIIIDPPNHFPSITLNGLNNMDITLNNSWTEPGFTATDLEDGDITSLVTIIGTVNNNLAGVYTIKYQVIDAKGYKTTVIRTVHVTNSLQYLSGSYLCTTSIQGFGNYIWNAPGYIGASSTKNNYLVLSRITDCYGLALDLEVTGTTLNLPGQYQLGYNTAVSSNGICDSIVHFFSGTGAITNLTTHPVITINYSDMYKDNNGNVSSYIKTDVYQKQ